LDRALAMTVADQVAAEAAARAAAERAAAEAAQAANLRDLLARLAAARRAELRREAAARARAASGPGVLGPGARPMHQLLAPVHGAVVVAYGAATQAGPASGITWRAAPGSAVVAPCGGTVQFAAPFQGYGRLLILACGGGYDVVIGGFARLAAVPGDRVRPGQTVGTLPGGLPRVYFELRHDGTALDPTPWLRG
ncbi:MAG: murein hydrolase activator EnvC family protein, partial [Acetobacteraceae bacterium]